MKFKAIEVLEQLLGFNRTFSTDLKTVSKVMNVSSKQLFTYLVQAKFELKAGINSPINEKMLDYLADMYVRKMKNYFNNSTKNICNLSAKEFSDLNFFYDQFKKAGKNAKLRDWEQIDSEAIRKSFIEQVKSLTQISIDTIWGQSIITPTYDKDETILPKVKFSIGIKILSKIIYSRFYLRKVLFKRHFHPISTIIQYIIISLKYHIFTDEDNNPNSVAIKSNATFWHIINTAPLGYQTLAYSMEHKINNHGKRIFNQEYRE